MSNGLNGPAGTGLGQEDLFKILERSDPGTAVNDPFSGMSPSPSEMAATAPQPVMSSIPSFPQGQETPQEDVSKEDQTEEDQPKSLEDAIKKNSILPTEQEKAALKAKYRTELTVVPFLTDNGQGKLRTAILRPLSRADWRQAKEYAVSMGQKGEASKTPDEYFQERLVSMAMVWPNISPVQYESERAGFIPTLCGVVEKISWFFDVNDLMQYTFTL